MITDGEPMNRIQVWSDGAASPTGKCSYAALVVEFDGAECKIIRAEADVCPDWITEAPCAEVYAALVGLVLAMSAWPDQGDVVLLHMDSAGASKWIAEGVPRRHLHDPESQRSQIARRIDAAHEAIANQGFEVEIVHVRAHVGAKSNRSERLNRLCDILSRFVLQERLMKLDLKRLTHLAGLGRHHPIGLLPSVTTLFDQRSERG